MNAGGEFLVLDNGSIDGCVYAKCTAERGYFGMLSIDPPKQGHGLGRSLQPAMLLRRHVEGALTQLQPP